MNFCLRKFVTGCIAASMTMGVMQVYGQDPSTYVPNVLQPSPDAAVLMKFGDVPVSPYTGTADVNVPMYTIKVKGMDLPVALDYHTGGVKVKEEATWVGLGWNCAPGGMVSRTIMDKDDFASGWGYFGTNVPQLTGDMLNQPHPASGAPALGPYIYDFYCDYLVATTTGNFDFTNAFDQGGVVPFDMESDIFSYDIPGHSGKNILTRAGQVVLQKKDNILIRFASNGQWFTITDDQGNTFYFGVHDQTLAPGGASLYTPTVWYMSKIVTQQNDSIVFNYTAGAETTEAPISQYYNEGYCVSMPGPATSQGPPTTYYCQTLNSIDFPTGRLVFDWDGRRSDLQGAAKLDSVLIYSKGAGGSLNYLRQFNLSYSYFNYPTTAVADSFELCRLRLDSVKEKSGGTVLPPYSFGYSHVADNFRVVKDSFDVDHWGYYNAAGNSQLIPSVNVEYNPANNPGPGSVYTYAGANREPNAYYMQAFALLQVNYPTGGKTVFSYEPNDYDYHNSQTGPSDFEYATLVNVDSTFHANTYGATFHTIDLTKIQPILPAGSPERNLTIHVTFRFQNNAHPSVNLNQLTFDFYNPSGQSILHEDAANLNCNSTACTVDESVLIAPIGVYSWSATIGSQVNLDTVYEETDLNFQYEVSQQDYNLMENGSEVSPASGLRIQSVINYSDATTIASKKVYNYGYLADKLGTGTPQQYSYGRLMAFPSYTRYVPETNIQGGNCFELSLFSSSLTQLSSVIQSNLVGYDQVTETSVDPATGNDIGRTVYTYFNSSDSTVSYGGFHFPGCYSLGNSINGSLLSKVTYGDAKGYYYPLAETDNFYHTTNRSVYFSPKYSFSNSPGGPLGAYCPITHTGVPAQAIACFYPSIKSERLLLDSSREIYYQQLDNTKSVSKITDYFYDNPMHYLPTRTTTTDSKHNKLVTYVHYPQDYIPSGNTLTGNTTLDSMIGRNMVSENLEKSDSLYYSGSPAGYVTGAQLSLYRIQAANANTIVPDKVYKLDIQAPVTNFQPFTLSGNSTNQDSRYEQKISFDSYDASSNIAQYTPEDQVTVSYLWDYSRTYPIAKVTGAQAGQAGYTSFEADGSGNWTVPSTARTATPHSRVNTAIF